MSGKQTNLQIPVRDETKELFNQAFTGSGSDSKGTFLREILDNYLSEDSIRTVEKEKLVDNPETEQKLNEALKQLAVFANHPVLVALFDKNKGKTFKFTDNKGKKREIKVEAIADVFEIIMSKVSPE
jgi:hypothetical protein